MPWSGKPFAITVAERSRTRFTARVSTHYRLVLVRIVNEVTRVLSRRPWQRLVRRG